MTKDYLQKLKFCPGHIGSNPVNCAWLERKGTGNPFYEMTDVGDEGAVTSHVVRRSCFVKKITTPKDNIISK